MSKTPPWYAMIGLAGLSAGIFMGVTAGSFLLGDPGIRNMLAGAAVTLVTTSFNYYFGSSAGSAKKDDTIASNAAAAAITAASNGPSSVVPVPAQPPLAPSGGQP